MCCIVVCAYAAQALLNYAIAWLLDLATQCQQYIAVVSMFNASLHGAGHVDLVKPIQEQW